jgi:hypothetical protein
MWLLTRKFMAKLTVFGGFPLVRCAQVPWCTSFNSVLHPKPIKKKSIWVRQAADGDETQSEKSGGGGGNGVSDAGAATPANGGGGGGTTGAQGQNVPGTFGAEARGQSGGGGLLGSLLAASSNGGVSGAAAAVVAPMANPGALSYSLSRPASAPLPRSLEQVKQDVSRVLSLAEGLPEKRATFVKELNKARAYLLAFHVSNVFGIIVRRLEHLRGGASVVPPEEPPIGAGAAVAATPTRNTILTDVLRQLAEGGPAAASKGAGAVVKDRFAPPPSAKKAAAKTKPSAAVGAATTAAVGEMVTATAPSSSKSAASKGGAASKSSASIKGGLKKAATPKSKSRVTGKGDKAAGGQPRGEKRSRSGESAPAGEVFDRKPKLLKTGDAVRVEDTSARPMAAETFDRKPHIP